jgi:hypothetical protein
MNRGAPGFLWLALAMLAPARLLAHGSEFILAKIVTPGGGRLQLELSADYLGNPMLGTEEAARTALAKVLAVRVGDKVLPIDSLAPLTFQKRADFDPDAPIPRSPADGSEQHAVLAASWSWKPGAESVSFEVPKGVPHSVIAWKHELGQPAAEVRWAILIEGDRSPPVAIPRPVTSPWMIAGFGSLAAVVVVAPFAWARRRSRR